MQKHNCEEVDAVEGLTCYTLRHLEVLNQPHSVYSEEGLQVQPILSMAFTTPQLIPEFSVAPKQTEASPPKLTAKLELL